MATCTYSPDQRSALRAAITSHAQWNDYRNTRGLSSSTLSVDDLESAATIFGIDVTLYGTPKGMRRRRSSSTPAAPASRIPIGTLRAELFSVEPSLTQPQRDYAADILADAAKHFEMITEKQAEVLRSMINRALIRTPVTAALTQAVTHPGAPAPVPAPAIITQTAPASITQPLDVAGALDVLRAVLGSGVAGALDEARVIDLIKSHAGMPAHVTIDLRTPTQVQPIGTDLMHHKLPLVVAAIQAGVPLFLTGDAGAGKTTMCKQAAKMLGRDFYFTGAINSEYKLTGFIDAQGRVIHTAFTRAFKEGGLFLFDELDGSLPGAVLPFNAALANRMADLPEGIIEAHAQFAAVAAGNTTGRGADRQYVGRLQQDAAVLDRYAMLHIDTDEALEAAMIGAARPHGAPLPQVVTPVTDLSQAQALAVRWLDRVKQIRAKTLAHKVRHIVSPRATVNGSRLLAAGWAWDQVEEACLFKGLDSDTRAKLAA